ncbi:putative 3-demethylubiquinone-9 3-methyltransferase (glyoxalase superfamily) [Sphingobium sp. OAS761]|uniref:VOC family protein n=1 Tax=Sphingobium sp. OAS761 TaxID=2817901 RepID=UPI00209F44DA|nr:VOC family protein [Sphingobium sp. OAS761]MCP1468788.1 putative 3-demethylubiquinone-9 3-methyltransferase (glyoxalase superfamily) [Sphingobium sp. OAS761]
MSRISPCLWFDGQAEEAARFYASVFGGTVDHVTYYPDENPSPSPLPGGSVLLVEFSLFGDSYQALNGGPKFPFTEAVSLSVSCADQAELDRYFDALTANGGKPGPCGWVTDKYGLSWQLVPAEVEALYRTDDKVGIKRMMGVMMSMQKLDLARMKAAFEGETA